MSDFETKKKFTPNEEKNKTDSMKNKTDNREQKEHNHGNSTEQVYDLFFDEALIIQSIAKQYHIMPSEQGKMSTRDYHMLVSGLMDDTPLGRVVGIRTEKDKDIIKSFGKEERRIRREWNNFKLKGKGKGEIMDQQQELEQMIMRAFS